MDLSIVICTRNRAARLPEMLTKLRDLRPPLVSWELILVDNNSSDNTLNVLKDFSLNSSIPITVVLERKNGLSNARNAGWRAARGAIISFTDDDCYPQEDWLITIINTFRDSDAGFVGGRVLLFDPEDAPVTIQTSTDEISFPANSYIESGQIIGANLSCRRALLEAVGGFDTNLGAGTPFHSGEDTEVLIKASLLGFTGRYEPAIVVYHHHGRKLKSDVTKLYQGYAFGRGALSLKILTNSNAKMLYFKHWYWRLRSLLRQRRGDYLVCELKGALSYARMQWLGRRQNDDVGATSTPPPDMWQYEGLIHGAARAKQGPQLDPNAPNGS